MLDLSKQVATDGERGLLGLAFSTDGRRLYVFAMIAADGRSSVAAYTMVGTTADPASRRELLAIPRRYANHNGGELAIGPDGYLYIGIGDGGSENDPDHRGQDTSTLFAKILRIDPDGGTGQGTGAGQAYGIPAGNPFEQGRRAPGDLVVGRAQPVALLVRPSQRGPVDRRRRPGQLGGGRPPPGDGRPRRRAGGQPRVEPDGGDAPLPRRHQPPGRGPPRRRVLARPRVLHHRRVRLPGLRPSPGSRAPTCSRTTAREASGRSS